MYRGLSFFLIFLFIAVINGYSAPILKGNSIAVKIDHSLWEQLLKKHVSANGKVDYAGFKSDSKKLDSYLKMLSNTNLSGYSKTEKQAYWINAYNAFTVDLVAKNYPVKSIKDIRNAKSLVAKATGGSQVWIEKLRYSFDGEELSLYNIENKKLLKDLFDPRIHFVINCASYSCPRLLNKAYTTGNLENLMNQMAGEFINDHTKNNITSSSAMISEIFKWYKGQFTRNGSLIDFLNKYSTVKIKPNVEIKFLEYNWALNE
ncbi:MAG: DUF547 domain-containing protein [Flavobacterium sp.]|nr:DUF547 domain-containing protein [Pedobacter sp.]